VSQGVTVGGEDRSGDGERSDLSILDLRTDAVVDPIGVGAARPWLSWRVESDRRQARPRAFEVRVARGGDPLAPGSEVVWESGRQDDVAAGGVTYGGRPLESRADYAWRVRVVDDRGRETDWSPLGRFEVGLLGESDWRAEWIGAPADDALARRLPLDSVAPIRSLERIWLPGADRVVFRTHLRVRPGRAILLAPLVLTGAARLRAWVDGRPVDLVAEDGAWVADVADLLRRHEQGGPAHGSVLVVEAWAGEGLPGGLLGRLEVVAERSTAVTVVTSADWRARSDPPADFAAPDLDDADWPSARPVGLHGDPPWGRAAYSYRPSPVFRRRFRLPGSVRRARLSASALGVYEFRLNGRPVSPDRLAPGWTDYHQRLAVQTYDVTDLVTEGDNVAVAIVGDGWYAGGIAWFGQFQYGTVRGLRAELDIELTSGERVVVGTDGTWAVGEGRIRYADLQNGEVHDLRAEPDGLDRPDFDERGWSRPRRLEPPRGRLEPAIGAPIRVMERRAPIAIRALDERRQLVDFGQNLVGWVRLEAEGPSGRHILLRHVEVLDERGEPYTANLRSARQTDEVVLAGRGVETFEPRFSVHGFRYVEVTGYPGELTPAAIEACVAFADMEQTGFFACSDPRLNRLQENIVWGQRGNFLSVPTDCPQRDERLGWTGDAQVFARTAAFNYDVRRFFWKWLRDLTDAQRSTGGIPFVAPHVANPDDARLTEEQRSSAGWGDAIVMVPFDLYRTYRDPRVVEETYAAALAWVDWLARQSSGHIRPDSGFGDWLSVGADTPRDMLSTAFYARAVFLTAELARVLGQSEDAVRLEAHFDAVRRAFRAAFVRGGEVAGRTQTAYVLALAFDLLEPEERPVALERLVADVEARNDHLSTGFLGTPYLLQTLAEAGRLDVAYRLLFQESYPSWLYPIAHGATTMWERWDTWTEHRGFQDPGMNSLNHYAYGAVGTFLYEVVGGLAPLAPGYSRVLVRPRPGGGLSWAETRFQSVHGPIRVRWERTAGTLRLEVDVPPGVEAEVHLPSRDVGFVRESGLELAHVPGLEVVPADEGVVCRVGSGDYRFEVGEFEVGQFEVGEGS